MGQDSCFGNRGSMFSMVERWFRGSRARVEQRGEREEEEKQQKLADEKPLKLRERERERERESHLSSDGPLLFSVSRYTIKGVGVRGATRFDYILGRLVI
ncbi:hypothetical protein EUGRSUZ_F00905 [Eucalyptus grandis]|uniref:Uncharacterized protein n=2 Tax=Eucalyptus grandis TaxID=71139 RepID=A0ACC3KCP0_EUCGR|nr:hypothetical protein EUGRSUZ_F00905 [Eucalyptus grandis]